MSFSISEQYKWHTPDIYVPFFTILEFISYMGWIKVAENLLNPFGDDDEDFQINYLIDRNLQVSYMIVDDAEMQVKTLNFTFTGKKRTFRFKFIGKMWEIMLGCYFF